MSAAAKVRQLVLHGDMRLRQICRDVALGEDAGSLVGDLLRTMQATGGVGLAAPQIGDGRRVLVCRRPDGSTAPPLAMINPVIEALDGPPVAWQEGCLSFPGLFLTIWRPRMIRVRYFDCQGNMHVLQDSSMLARIVQHEVDHLDGVLFSDHLPRWRRWMLSWRLGRLKRLQRRAQEMAA